MKTTYSLKSSIHNSHAVVCQDASKVELEKIDSVFAKLFYPAIQTGLGEDIDYKRDEAIRKYNQKADSATRLKLSPKEALPKELAKFYETPIIARVNHYGSTLGGDSKPGVLVLVNPYKLRNYAFTIPEYISMILSITAKSKILVYCPLDLGQPLESSEVNYLFPIIFNTQSKLVAQIPLSIMDYPDFHKQKLRTYL